MVPGRSEVMLRFASTFGKSVSGMRSPFKIFLEGWDGDSGAMNAEDVVQ
jgi:hypothetical protein